MMSWGWKARTNWMYKKTQTQWNRKYKPRFYVKHSILRDTKDKYDINNYTIQIANHPTPNNIGGCATCSEGDYKKLEFNTGWIIICNRSTL